MCRCVPPKVWPFLDIRFGTRNWCLENIVQNHLFAETNITVFGSQAFTAVPINKFLV